MPANPATVAHGPALIGTFLNVLLYGIMVCQVYLYFTRFKRDKTWMKLFVSAVFIADGINVVFDIVWIYSILINSFGDTNALRTANWIFATDPAMVGIIATMCQCFFAWRIHVLLDRWYLTVVVLALALCSAACGIGTAVYIHFIPEFEHFQKFSTIVIVWLISAAAADIIITAVLTWHIRKNRFKLNDNVVSDVVDRLLRMTVQNGLLTAIAAIADLIAFLATPTGLHLAFNFPLAKLYSNTLLSTLNARMAKGSGSSGLTSSGKPAPSSGGNRRDVINLNQLHQGTQNPAEVYINVETVHDVNEVADDYQKRVAPVEWDYEPSARRGTVTMA